MDIINNLRILKNIEKLVWSDGKYLNDFVIIMIKVHGNCGCQPVTRCFMEQKKNTGLEQPEIALRLNINIL